MEKRIFVLVFIYLFLVMPCYTQAEDPAHVSKKNETQQVGGLLFDVDEGSKIEKGPGGSVYVKSNREYMQQKFSDIETKLSELEARTAELENKLKSLAGTVKKPASEKPAQESSERQVLVS